MNADDKMGLEILGSITATLFASGFWIRYKEVASRSWPKASGLIVTSTIKREPGPKGGEQITPVIEYEFQYQGRSFRTSHWRLGNFTVGNSYSADPVVARYPVGASVTVFVNPRHPEKSVLETIPSALSWVPFGFGVFFLFLSVFVILAITKR